MNLRVKNKNSSKVDLNKSYRIILKPIVTEKATRLSEHNKVVFSVLQGSNKIEIKNAIEKLFSVKVKTVNTINIKGKRKRLKGIMGKRNDIKKAIVTLEKGNSIDLSARI
tara:strand:+ start:428 stop:757 length:330 start_codon:yes stop_codon:yes gene_type:complete